MSNFPNFILNIQINIGIKHQSENFIFKIMKIILMKGNI
jgi:hypothetical protein